MNYFFSSFTSATAVKSPPINLLEILRQTFELTVKLRYRESQFDRSRASSAPNASMCCCWLSITCESSKTFRDFSAAVACATLISCAHCLNFSSSSA